MKRKEATLRRNHPPRQRESEREEGRPARGGEEFRGQYRGVGEEDVAGEESRRLAQDRVRRYRGMERKHKVPGRKNVNLTQDQHEHYLRLKAGEAASRMEEACIELTPREGADALQDAARVWEESKIAVTPRRLRSAYGKDYYDLPPRLRSLEEMGREHASRERLQQGQQGVAQHGNGRNSALENEGEFEKWDSHGRKAGRMERTDRIAARVKDRAIEVNTQQEAGLDALEARVLDQLRGKRESVERRGKVPKAQTRAQGRPRYGLQADDTALEGRAESWEVTPRLRQPHGLPPGFS